MKYNDTYQATRLLTDAGLTEAQANTIVNIQEETMSESYRQFEKRMDEKFKALQHRIDFSNWTLALIGIAIVIAIFFKP